MTNWTANGVLGALVDNKLNMSQKCTSRSREGIILLYLALVRLFLEWWVQFWSPLYKIRTYWSEGSEGLLRCLRIWSIWHTKKEWESWNGSVWRRESWGGSYGCVQIPDKGRTRLLVMSSERTSGDKQLVWRKFCLNIENELFPGMVVKCWDRLSREVVESSSVEILWAQLGMVLL